MGKAVSEYLAEEVVPWTPKNLKCAVVPRCECLPVRADCHLLLCLLVADKDARSCPRLGHTDSFPANRQATCVPLRAAEVYLAAGECARLVCSDSWILAELTWSVIAFGLQYSMWREELRIDPVLCVRLKFECAHVIPC
jgi:hypothetical protein